VRTARLRDEASQAYKGRPEPNAPYYKLFREGGNVQVKLHRTTSYIMVYG